MDMLRLQELRELLNEVKKLAAGPDTDVVWSRFDSRDAVLTALDACLQGLAQHEEDVLDELKLLFAPTGALQEISSAGGWGEAFLVLAGRFDELCR